MNASSLLDRALLLKTQSDSLIDENSIDDLLTIPKDINAPLKVFDFICSRLGISTAILLMLDKNDGIYFPIILKNFDETSRLRFRLTKENIKSLQEGHSKINHYLSYTDSKSITQYFFVPLCKNEINFYLFCCSNAINVISDNQLNFIHKNINIIDQIINVKLPFPDQSSVQKLPPVFNFLANQHLLQKNKKSNIYLLAIDAKEYIKRVLTHINKTANPYKQENEILSLFQMNLSELGFVTRINFGEYLAYVEIDHNFSIELVTQQIQNSLNTFFNNNKKLKQLNILSTKFFHNISSMEKTAMDLLAQI